MTPRPAAAPYYPREVEHRRESSGIKTEVVKYLLSAVVAALTAYFATIYGIREEVAVLKVHLEYLRKQVDQQSAAIDSLTRSVNAHMAAHHGATTP